MELKRWFSSWEQVLLQQGPGVQFPALRAGGFQTTGNSSSRNSNTLFRIPRALALIGTPTDRNTDTHNLD